MEESVSKYFQDIVQSFTEIDYLSFLLNLVVTAVLASLLSVFYVRFGNAATNRKHFSRNFLPLSMTTMLIIFIVKSSVALSLGLVGALSIVRFRSAIKEPEELTYLFLTIGIGLGCGANEPMIAIFAFVFILAVLFIQSVMTGKGMLRADQRMHLNISVPEAGADEITNILTTQFDYVELKRMDIGQGRTDFSFLVSAKTIDQLETVRKAIQKIQPEATISFIEQRNIAA